MSLHRTQRCAVIAAQARNANTLRRHEFINHRRMGTLSGPERQFLTAAAVIGPEFSLRDVAALLEQPTIKLLAVIESLLVSRLITIKDEHCAFVDVDFWREVIATLPRPVLLTLREEASLAAGSGRPRGTVTARLSVNEPMTVSSIVRLSNQLWAGGSPVEALERGREAVNTISERTPLTSRLSARVAQACKLLCLRDTHDADSLIETVGRDVAGQGLPGQAARLKAVQALSSLQQGRTNEARASAGQVLRHAAGTSATTDSGQVARAILALSAVRNGDLAAAQSQTRHLVPEDITDSVFPTMYLKWVTFLVSSAEYEAGDALDLAATRFPELLDCRVIWYEEPAAAPWLIRLALDCGDRRLAAEIADRVAQMAAEMPELAIVADTASYSRALVADDLAGLECVAATHRDPWSVGLASEDLALRLCERKDQAGAAHWLASSLRIFESLDTRRDLERVRGRLKGLNVRRPGAGMEGRGQWKDLTQTERKIARLVADGLTNREIADNIHLSPHTVNYYLRRIFQKLNIRSRAQVATVLT